jgi:PAS domain S-box-containing protein
MMINTHKIKTKLFLAFFFLILSAGVIGGISYLYLRNITNYQSYRNEVEQLKNLTLRAKGLQKDFLANDAKSSDYMRNDKSGTMAEFLTVKEQTEKGFKLLKNHQITKELALEEPLNKSQDAWQNYHQIFQQLVEKVRYRGFKDYGLEGEMREYAHQLEALKEVIDEAQLLTLRRHEKDFIIRKETDYIAKLHRTAADIIGALKNNDSIADKENLIATIKNYEKHFDRIVLVEKEIGLSEESGLRGQLNKSMKKLDDEISKVDILVSLHTEELIWQAKLIVISAIIVMLITATIFAVFFAYSVSRPIEVLDRITQSVVKGLRSQEQLLDKIDSEDEVGNLARNFKVMLTKLKTSIAEAEERNVQLENFAREEAKRTWASEGLALFGEILKNNYNNLERQSYEIISTLVTYTNSNQGGIFIVNDEENAEQNPFLELKAAYAYERQRFLKKTVQYGEGLIGTAWREQDTRIITDIPADYVHITSGLGKATPTCLLIVPIKNDNTIEGVIELVSFKQYEDYEIDFIERLSRRIATTIAAVKANEKNAKLLAASREMAEKLQLKEAELKRKIDSYENWVKQFEEKLNNVAEEAHVYQTIINRMYEGIILTNERFIITKVNNYILKRFGYTRQELEGQSVDVLIETDYNNVIDLKKRRFELSYKSFTQNVTGKVIDHQGGVYPVEMMSGKLEVEHKIIYVFLFNEAGSEKAERGKSLDKDFFSMM